MELYLSSLVTAFLEQLLNILPADGMHSYCRKFLLFLFETSELMKIICIRFGALKILAYLFP